MNIASEYLPTPEDKESRRKGAKVRGKVRDGTGIACFPSAFGGNEASELLRTSFEVIFAASRGMAGRNGSEVGTTD